MALIMSTIFMGEVYASERIREYTYVVIWETDSTCNVYKSSDNPIIIPTADYLSLRVNGTEVQYPANKPFRITFSKTPDIDTAVEEVITKGMYEITQTQVSITGLDKTVKNASIYSVDGKQVLGAKTENGTVTLNISDFKAGIYVVKCGDVNFKFLKK